MNQPCTHPNLRIINSRKVFGTVIRRKHCDSCGKDFYTKEIEISKDEYLNADKVYHFRVNNKTIKLS